MFPEGRASVAGSALESGHLAVPWTLANPAVHAAIVGTLSPDHV
jgi:aryl-alcohol dehydrogenase-like predicted oxidoreductase